MNEVSPYFESMQILTNELERIESRIDSLLSIIRNQQTAKLQDMVIEHVNSYMQAAVKLTAIKEVLLTRKISNVLDDDTGSCFEDMVEESSIEDMQGIAK